MSGDRGAEARSGPRPAGAIADPSAGLVLDGLGLVVFDKDGTLTDFDAMWAGWATELARRLGDGIGREIDERLYAAIGFAAANGRAIAGGPLAAMPMGQLRRLTVGVVAGALGVGAGAPGEGVADPGSIPTAAVDAAAMTVAAEAIVGRAWHTPDPVALAHPLADVPALFRGLRDRGVRIAVATSDDRAPTEATLAALGLSDLVDVVVCADDGLPVKPAPDAVLHACRILGIAPADTAMVGDAPADLEMGRAAGVGLVVGVLSGVGRREDLEPFADAIVPSIASLTAG